MRRPATAAAKGPSPDALLALVEGSRGGVSATPPRAAVEREVDALVASASVPGAGAGAGAGGSMRPGVFRPGRRKGLVSGTNGDMLSGCWRLAWTSERETLWLLDKGIPLTRLVAGESYQTIDVGARTLSNVIEFCEAGVGGPSTAAFVVDAELAPEAPSVSAGRRCTFSFTSARFVTRDGTRVVRFPPFGRGWFDTVFLEPPQQRGGGGLRVARDSRGDTLVTERQPPGRVDAWWDAVR